MRATELLGKQHRVVADLFEKIEKSKEDDKKEALFEELAGDLAAHDGQRRQENEPAAERDASPGPSGPRHRLQRRWRAGKTSSPACSFFMGSRVT